MSKPANKKVIGLFVLGAIALLVLALVVFGSGKLFKKTYPIVFYFEGSVKGLNVGSSVVFRGVKVGSVTDVELLFDLKDSSTKIRVVADYDPGSVVRVGVRELVREYSPRERVEGFRILIDRGLRAQLQMQSVLTGQLMINLDFMPGTPARLVGTNPDVVEIPTVPTTAEELAQKLAKLPIEETLEKLSKAIQGVEEMINSPEVQGGMKSLSRSAAELEKLVKSIHAEIKPLSDGIHGTLKDARALINQADRVMNDGQKLIQNVDRRVDPLASKVEGTLDATRNLVSEVNVEVGPVASDLKKTLEEARGAIAQAQKTLKAAEANYAEGSAFYYELTEALSGLNEASHSIGLLGEYLKRHPDSVLWGKGKPGGK